MKRTSSPAGPVFATTVHLPSGRPAVVALGVGEAAIGLAFLLRPGAITGGLLAAAYLAFAAFLLVLLRRHAEGSTCGCLGEGDAPPSRLHVGLDLAAAGAASAAAVLSATGSAVRSPLVEADRLGWAGVPFVVGIGLVAWLAALTVAHVPRLFSSWEPPA